jgi:zinc/manganese transport system substrate-binding protein
MNQRRNQIMTFTRILFVILAIFLALPVTAQPKKLNVVTTLNYLAYVTNQVGGDQVAVTALANPRQDPHYVTPTPRMNQLASTADLFIENGLSLDLWAKNVLDASGNPSIQPGGPGHLIATINAPVKELPTEVSRSWGDIHPQGNPHIWLDPLNVRIIAENIANRLSQIDRPHAFYFGKRLQEFQNRLDVAMYGEELLKSVGKSAGDILARRTRNGDLLRWLKSRNLDAKLGGWMKLSQQINGLKVVSYHKTYVYFADRFGLNLVEELEEKPGIPPPPQHRDAIVERVRQEHIPIILNDNFYSRDAADYIASKTGAKVMITYIDVSATPTLDTYEKLIQYLLEEIVQSRS